MTLRSVSSAARLDSLDQTHQTSPTPGVKIDYLLPILLLADLLFEFSDQIVDGRIIELFGLSDQILCSEGRIQKSSERFVFIVFESE